mgnify:CR=1 FL=1
MSECIELITQYLSFLQSSLRCSETGEGYCIITPFLTPDNDPLMVYVRQDDGGFYLSDHGHVAEFLFHAGAELETNEARMQLASSIVRSMQVEMINGEIVTKASVKDFGAALHRIIHAMREVCDLVYTAQPGPPEKSFKEIVLEYLMEYKVEPEIDFEIQGESISHRVDFYRDGSRPRAIDTLSARNVTRARQIAIETAFKWLDIRKVNPIFEGFSLYDDRQEVWSEEVLRIISHNSAGIFPWSQRERALAILR